MKDNERLNLEQARGFGAVIGVIKRPRRRCPKSDPLKEPPMVAERNVMYRLPGCDRKTHGFELAVFLGLGLAALMVIGVSLASSVQFAMQREAITAAVSGQPSPALAVDPEHVKTNLAVTGPQQFKAPRQPNAQPCVQSM
jgi:hypothetical protein